MYTLTVQLCFLCLFLYLILRGDPLSQRLLFWGHTESLQVHTHTITDNTIMCNPEQSSFIVYTHTLRGQW